MRDFTKDFHILTEEDKTRISYGACVGTTTLTGMAVGRLLGLQGLIGGGVAGLAWGLLLCPLLQEPIKDKLFSPNTRLSDQEITSALRAVRHQRPLIAKQDAMTLLAQVRLEVSRHPQKYKRAREA